MKKILFIVLTLCSLQLQARKITIIKSKSANKVKSISYLSYKPQGYNIILSELTSISLKRKKAVSFDIPNNHSNLDLVMHMNGTTLAANIRLETGKNSLTYKLSKVNNKINLTPVVLSPAKHR